MERQQLRGKVLLPKSCAAVGFRPIESMRQGKKVRLSNLTYERPTTFVMTPNRQPLSPYETTARMSSLRGKRKGKSIGLSSRRVSLGEGRTNGSLTPTPGTTHTAIRINSPKAHRKEVAKGSKVRLRKYTRSPSPTLVTLPSRGRSEKQSHTTHFPPKSTTPDLAPLSRESSDENIIQTPAEEDEGRLSPALAYAKILDHSINSYMNISRGRLPKSQNTLMTMGDLKLRDSEESDLPRGSEAEPEPGISINSPQMRYTAGPDETGASVYTGASPLVRRLRYLHKPVPELSAKPPQQPLSSLN